MHELPLMAFFMNHSKRKSTAPPSLQCARGATLAEVMAAIVVLSIGLLGIAGLQAATLKYKINAWARSSASTFLSDLAERVRINPDSAGNRFAETGADIASKYVIGDPWAAQPT